MKNKNLKIKRGKGRPEYQANIEQLQALFEQVANKEITNEERLEASRMSENEMV